MQTAGRQSSGLRTRLAATVAFAVAAVSLIIYLATRDRSSGPADRDTEVGALLAADCRLLRVADYADNPGDNIGQFSMVSSEEECLRLCISDPSAQCQSASYVPTTELCSLKAIPYTQGETVAGSPASLLFCRDDEQALTDALEQAPSTAVVEQSSDPTAETPTITAFAGPGVTNAGEILDGASAPAPAPAEAHTCALSRMTGVDVQPGESLAEVANVMSEADCLAQCQAYNPGTEQDAEEVSTAPCASAVYDPRQQRCWLKSGSIEEAVPARQGISAVVLYCAADVNAAEAAPAANETPSEGPVEAPAEANSGTNEDTEADTTGSDGEPDTCSDCFNFSPDMHTEVGGPEVDAVIMNGNSRWWPVDGRQACWDLCCSKSASDGCISATYGTLAGADRCYLKPEAPDASNTSYSDTWGVISACGHDFGGEASSEDGGNDNADANSGTDTELFEGPTCPEQAQKLSVGRANKIAQTSAYGADKYVELAFRPTNDLCGNTLTLKGNIIVKKENGDCEACPTAECKIWHPDATGEYSSECSALVTPTSEGTYSITTSSVGNELSKNWGPDPYGHFHYDCTGCGMYYYNKVYVRAEDGGTHDFSINRNRLGFPDEGNFIQKTSAGQKGQDGVFTYNVLMDVPIGSPR